MCVLCVHVHVRVLCVLCICACVCVCVCMHVCCVCVVCVDTCVRVYGIYLFACMCAYVCIYNYVLVCIFVVSNCYASWCNLYKLLLTTQLEVATREKEPRPGAQTRGLCSNAEFQHASHHCNGMCLVECTPVCV